MAKKLCLETPTPPHLSNVGFRGQRLTISVVFLKSTIQHSLSPWLTRHAATRFELLFPALFFRLLDNYTFHVYECNTMNAFQERRVLILSFHWKAGTRAAVCVTLILAQGEGSFYFLHDSLLRFGRGFALARLGSSCSEQCLFLCTDAHLDLCSAIIQGRTDS